MIDSTPPKYDHNKCNDNHNKSDNFEKPSEGVTNFDFCYNLQPTVRYHINSCKSRFQLAARDIE